MQIGATPPVFSDKEARQANRLLLVLVVTAAFVGLELAGAVLANSDVLRADAAHLFLDVIALASSLVAMRVAVRAPDDRFTFGWRRVEPLAALLNGVVVLAVAVLIAAEAIEHLHSTSSPRPTVMLVVAAAALVVHGASAWLIHDAIEHGARGHAHEAHEGHDRGHALNLRAVWLHLAGDVMSSITALAAAVVIRFGGSPHVDAAGSLLVAVILLGAAGKVMRDATLVLLDAAPPHLPSRAVRDLVLGEPGVLRVHELRVWSLGAGHDAVMARVGVTVEDRGLPQRLRERLHRELGVELVIVEVDVE